MVEHGADINPADGAGRTPLLRSFTQGCGDVAFLLENGADVHARDKRRMTALHQFAMGEDRENDLQLLLQACRQVDARESRGYTPLHYAAMVLPKGDRLITTLLEGGANPNLKDRRGDTPLHYAVSGCALESIRLLLAVGADIHAINRKGVTPLAIAETETHIRNILFQFDSPPSAKAYADTVAALRQAGAQK